MDYLNFKLGNKQYIQRNEFSKIIVYKDGKKEYIADDIKELSTLQQQIIKDAINIAQNPDTYFIYKTYADDENSIYITDYIGNFTENIVIPSHINGKKVCGIDKIFSNHNEIKRIIMPDTIEQIYSGTFEGASYLSFVQLSPKITKIPPFLFSHCKELKYVNLENITQIGKFAFNSCESLENVNLQNVCEIKEFAFNFCDNLKSVNLPKIINIEEGAFKYCINLTSAVLNNELTVIPKYLFGNCENLNKINLPNKLVRIEDGAFKNCLSIKTINFPETLRQIGELAFSVSGLECEIYFPKKLMSIGSCAFERTNIVVHISEKTRCLHDTFSLDVLLTAEFYEEEKTSNKNEIQPER